MKNLKKISRNSLKEIKGNLLQLEGNCICMYCYYYNGTGSCSCGNGQCDPK
ncbi:MULTISPECIES: bacteriocin-like protein [Elizabethkingia]|uniref:bacteriocin-like protein n=1 Tax=Elizabethkingia TaxID=308865 RepID=UPI0038911893